MKISFHLLLVYSLFILNHSVIGHSIQSHTKKQAVRLEEIAIHTLSESVKGVDEFDLTFKIQGQDSRVRLRLKPNRDIFARDAQIQYLDTRGAEQISHKFREDQGRVFKGDVWLYYTSKGWQPSGRARVYIVEGGISPLFQGSLTISNRRFHVNIVSDLGGTAGPSIPHVEITTSDDSLADFQNLGSWETVNKRHSTYGGDLIFGMPLALNRMPLLRRQSLEHNAINDSTVGYSTSPRVASIGLVTDCTYRAAFGSVEEMRRELVSMVNSASEAFERSFNISISIRNLTISDETCPDIGIQSVPWNVPCPTRDLNWRLNQFASWRGLQNDTNAYWTLMTNCPTGNVVGISLVGELCSRNEGVNVVVRTSNQWQVFAHESGHTFGAMHDCDSQTCSSSPEQCCPLSSSTCDAAGLYIMSPASSSDQTDFSPCTISAISSSLSNGTVETGCLVSSNDPPTITAAECGNGIVEEGEECDCGENCDQNACCNGATCQFTDRAVCDDAAEPCCTDCQFANTSTVCRPSSGPCDIPETCPGNNASCPPDTRVADGQSCGNTSGLFCASGQCTNRDMQCQEFLNTNTTSVSSCDSESCRLHCSTNSYGPGSYCISFEANVMDGTPCGSGLCSGGSCSNIDATNSNGSSWFDRNHSLVIGLTLGLGGALLIGILIIIVLSCCRSHSAATKKDTSSAGPDSYSAAPPLPSQTLDHRQDRLTS